LSTTELLERLRDARIKLAVKDGKLSINAPKGALTPELRDLLKASRDELIELLTASATARTQDRSPIPVADRSAPLPLSYAQQRFWFLEEFEGGSSVYNIPLAMRISGELDADALERAINDLVARHEALRTTFSATDDGPVQVVHDTMPIAIERVSLPGASDPELRHVVEGWAATRFDLAAGPLLRAGLIELGRDDRVLSLVIHHIVIDGWSLDVLQTELFAFYTGHVSGIPLTLSPLPIQLADYAAWQRSQAGTDELEAQLEYWKTQLNNAPPIIELPTDRTRPAEQSYKGSTKRRQLPGELSRDLKSMAGDRNVTLFMLLLSAYQVLLARYSGQQDIVVGTPVAGRQQTELEGLIGLFLNTLAIRSDLSADPTFNELLLQTRENALDAFANQSLPFDSIVDALGTERNLSHTPIFQVQFILQNAPASGKQLEGLQFAPLDFDYGTSKFDLTLAIAETSQGIAAEVEYCSDLFDGETIERMLQHYEVLLTGILVNPDLPVSRLPLIGVDERRHLLTDLNDTAVSYPEDATLQSLLEQQAAASPEALALTFNDEQLSYADLNARSNRLAHWLRSQGVAADDMVGVYMERSIDMVVALLGIVKAGGAYVPLDPDYPEQRLRHMLEDAGMRLILTQSRLAKSIPKTAATIFEIDTQMAELAAQNTENPAPLAKPNNIAYVIFTSGSTGRPKGVMNEHRGIVNRLLWMQSEYKLDATDRVLQKTPFSFDVSVWEFFWPLISGATLVVAKPGGHKDSDYLCELIRSTAITTLHFVPSMLQVFLQDPAAKQCTSLRRVVCSGEALSHDLQTRFYLTLDAQLHNLYGPTEAAIDVTYWACQRDSRDTSVPIGRPVANTLIYIVEPNGEPAPMGVAGELWIGGTQVARGYANRPDLTAERFIPDPFAAAQDARVYRTGDLARHRNDGAIEFLGRIDHQVKLRGFRIELGEIEACLDGLSSIEQSLVMLRETAPGNKQLIAYITGSDKSRPDVPALRESLKAQLPEYMVPAAFVTLDEFPLLPNGKVDRKSLPEPEGNRDVASEYVPPGTPVEKTLARIWADLLRVERVGIHDNFFELGGDSILSIQIITRAARDGVHLQPKQVFRYQTIAELAGVAGKTGQATAEQGLVTGTAPLTPVQQWFFAHGDTEIHHFNQSIRLQLASPIAAEALNTALLAIVEHHDALRATFTKVDESWQQRFGDEIPTRVLRTINMDAIDANEREQLIVAEANKLQSGFTLDSGCLMGALLCTSTDSPADLLISIHHLAMDGMSWRILLEDLETACRQLINNQAINLPPKSSAFRDWAERLNEYAAGDAIQDQRDWWENRVWPVAAGVPVDRAGGDNTVASTATEVIQLAPELTRQLLQEAPRAYRTRINDLLLAAFARAWQDWAGQESVCIDLEGHGREEKFADLDISRTLGWFTTIYPVCIGSEPAEPIASVIKRTKEGLRSIPDNGFSYGVLRYLSRPPLTTNAEPQVMFNYLGQFDQTFDSNTLVNMADGSRGYEQGPHRQRSHLLEVNGGVYDGQLNVSVNYSTSMHERASVRALADAYKQALNEVIAHCLTGQNLAFTPSDFPLADLDQGELDVLVADNPDLEDIYPATPMQHGMLFHSLFVESSADHLSQVYLTQVLWDLEGQLDPPAFEKAWQIVTDRHASLRTAFRQSAAETPLAIVHRRANVTLQYEDWRQYETNDRETRLTNLINSDREHAFELHKPPLMRLFLIRWADTDYRFLWSHHHVIMDGWSIPVVLNELFTAYEAVVANQDPKLPTARNYRGYIEWLQDQDNAEAAAHWRAALAGFSAPTPLPGARQDWKGMQEQSVFAKHYATLSDEETRALRDLARRLRLTMNSLAQGLWSLLLSRYTGEDDVLFGATTSGRPAELRNVEDIVGLFLNTIPVRARIEPSMTAQQWLAGIQEDQLAARQHEYASLTDIQGWSDVPRGTPLFHSLLIFENYPDVSALWEDRNAVRVTGMQALGWTSFPLSAAVSVGSQLVLRLAYDTTYYDPATAAQIAELYSDTIRALLNNPNATVRDLLRLPAPARTGAAPGPRIDQAYEALPADAKSASLVSLFEAQVNRAPDAIAVATITERHTYAELNAYANRVAHALLSNGAAAGDRVGLMLGHSAIMPAGLLGVLKAGLAYVPLDTTAPEVRLQQIIADAGVCRLVCDAANHERASVLAANAVSSLTVISASQDSHVDATNPGIKIDSDALAYILFTSGSTGTPKGVMQQHRNVVHHIRTYVDALHIDASDRLSLFAPYGFDAAVMDIYGALLTGACLCPIDMKSVESAHAALDQLHDLKITVFHATPTVYRFLFEQSEGHDHALIRLVVLGGEEARPGDLQLFQQHCRDDAIFVNGLGPTESTLALQYFASHSTPIPPQALPVGQAVAGTEILLLDDSGEPAGLAGEICIRSPYVTPGYWNDDALTAAAFTTDDAGQRIYRTGDLGRFNIDGQLVFIGRRDAQIKVRGHRIEPGEIEVAIVKHPGIERCVVVLAEDDSGEARLTAYCVAEPDTEFDTADLRQHVKNLLPDYMVPAAFVAIAEIPLTPNGKLDRHALPAPSFTSSDTEYVAPQTEIEVRLAELWCDVLKVQRVGLHDDFFELGGHSLIATQLMARLRDELQADLPLRALFDNPTVAGLATLAAESDGASAEPIPVRDRSATAPLSYTQQRLWFLDQLDPGSSVYNISWAIRIVGGLNRETLQQAVNDLVERHESLRTCFVAGRPHPLQVVADDAAVTVQQAVITEAKLQQHLETLVREPFDLRHGPLLRLHMLELDHNNHVLVVMIHHIISDAWSSKVLMRDLQACYDARAAGTAPNLPPLPVQFADYAVWQREWLAGGELQRQLEFWKNSLDGAPTALDLPTDRPRPAAASSHGAHSGWQLPARTAEELRHLAQAEGCTLFMVLIAAYCLLLSRHSGQDDLLIGTPIAGRKQRDLEELIGFFVNTLVLRARPQSGLSFRDYLRQIRRDALDAFAHQELPFEKLVEELQPERDMSRSPLFQAAFIMQNTPVPVTRFATLECADIVVEHANTKFDLSLGVWESDKNIAGSLEYNTDLFDASTIERMLGHFTVLLESIVENPDMAVDALPLMPEAERQQLLTGWNDTALDYAPATVHALFEQQAALKADATALWTTTETLSYGELNRRANKLAAELITLGVGPDVLVGICAERHAGLIVAMLATLKAGGAYVPLDPAYPPQRVAYMLDDSAAPVLLTQSSLLDTLPEHAAHTVCLDRFDWTVSEAHDASPATAVSDANLAYTIYTSGSTGLPKGVMIEHRNTVALIEFTRREFSAAELDGVLASTSVCFDLSVWEIFCTLSLGGRVVLAENALQLPALPDSAQVRLINTVPSAIAELLRVDGLPDTLTTVNLAGEPLSTRLVNAIYASNQVERVYDLYGPSEDTTYSTWTLREADKPPSIGRPVYNTRAYIVDSNLQPVPVGVPGELLLAGAGVTRGYLGKPALTAEKYLSDSFGDDPDARLYRTGDKARYRPDGTIEFLGRIDQQIKLRGFRIELGEIEASAEQHASVAEAVAMVREDMPGDSRLVAYLVGADDVAPDADAVRSHLQQFLPAYMVPAALVVLDELPRTPNGKLNRKALPAPEWSSADAYVAPRTELEEQLAEIWAAVLGVSQVGVQDDFFALGGHSLLASKLISRVRDQLRVELPLLAIFEKPTIAGLATEINPLDEAVLITGVNRRSDENDLPLSFAQRRLWFLNQLDGGSATYNISLALQIAGAPDIGALQQALDRLVERHEQLRANFVESDGHPSQVIAKKLDIPLQIQALTEAEPAAVIAQVNGLARTPFDIAKDALLRAYLLRTGSESNILLLVAHHIIADGWSLGILMQELATLYSAACKNQSVELANSTLQYPDYSVWQREWLNSTAADEQLEYWRETLAGAPTVLQLQTDHPRPPVQTSNGAHLNMRLSSELAAELRDLATSQNCTLFMLLLAAYNVLLARYTGTHDIVVGTPVAGRSRTELEEIVGLFVNTLALRTDLSGDPDFVEVLERTRHMALAAFARQELPFERLVEELQPERDTSHTPVFQTLFVLQENLSTHIELPDLQAQPLDLDSGTAKFDLSMYAVDFADGLTISIEYNTDLFAPMTIERMLMQFRSLLESITQDPTIKAGRLNLLPMTERQQLLTEWNTTQYIYPPGSTMHGKFEMQVQQQPDAPALYHDGLEISYRELNRRANKLAAELRNHGVGPEVLAAVCCERCPEMIIAMLAIQKAGGAYVPVDPEYPAERVALMLTDSEAPVLLTQSSLLGQLPDTDATVICLDDFDWMVEHEHDSNPVSGVNDTNLGYVIYTSGSTGLPKGVMIEHRNAVALIEWAGQVFTHDEFAGVLASTSICFDLSVFEIFCPLGLGGRIVLVKDALALPELDSNAGVTLINSVPSAMGELVRMRGVPASVKTVNLAGEPLTTALVNDIYALGTIECVNDLYGPSEDTTYSTWTRREANAVPTIGRPIYNTQAYVLDPYGEPVPIGVPGELFLAGAGVTRGYRNRPELTAERYVSNPFDAANPRMYRTGDKVRYDNDGQLHFLGRLDHQVKLRGFRIELGEIEAALSAVPEITQCVVIMREDTPGDPRLVAYYVADGATAADKLAVYLREKLPHYMLPTLVELDAMPMTPNGKIDRKRLPQPEFELQADYQPPRNATEELLAQAWATTLGVDNVGIGDDFFALGGHSLLATQLLSRVRDTLQIELPLVAIFNNPTVAELAAYIAASAGGELRAAVKPRSQDNDIPLSFAQQRLWFLDQLEPGNPVYNLPWAMQLNGQLDSTALHEALSELAQRHESLRTVFKAPLGTAVQHIDDTPRLELTHEDTAELNDTNLLNRLNELARQPFDLENGPLFRATLLRREEHRHVLLLNLHHSIADGWSLGVIYRELSALYAARIEDRDAELPALAVQYADYSLWQQDWFAGSGPQQQLEYWRARLEGAPAILELPTDRPRGAAQTYNGAHFELPLSDSIRDGLLSLARSENATLYMVCLAAFNILLARYSGQKDISVGTPLAGRPRSELENIIGCFVNTLVMRNDLSGEPDFPAVIRRVRKTALDAYAHQDLPFEKLVDELHPNRDMSHAPLFQVAFIMQNTPWDKSARLQGLDVQPLELDPGVSKFDLSLIMADRDDGLSALFEYNTDLFDQATIERMADHFERLLNAAIEHPKRPIGVLSMLTAAEQQKILYQWNDTAAPYADDSCIHTLIEQRTAQQPGNPAILFKDESITFADMNSRANQLARHLVDKGAGPGTFVGIALSREPDLVISILAVFKAGAAYIPLDPDYPNDRLSWMLSDSSAELVITRHSLRDQLPTHAAEWIELDTQQDEIAAQANDNLPCRSTAEDLAYVIYTSGSTGKPKGVMVRHQGVCNLANAQSRAFGLGPQDRMLQFASISFDASIFEIVMGLQVGAALVLAPRDDLQPGPALLDVLQRHAVTAVTLPPTALSQLPAAELPALHTITVAGEACPPDLVRQWATDRRFFNLYGPTESTVWASFAPCLPGEPITIGRPISNARLYVVDEHLQPVPIGVPGELCIGGAGLARGYLNREQLSNEKFLRDPFRGDADARIYRSGDLVRYLESGDIEFLGRIDHQVKLRGFRIELGEIESRLATHPDIAEAVVIARGTEMSTRQLVAYIVTTGGAEVSLGDVRAHLKAELPEFMVPAAFVVLDEFPLTPNRKVDRDALPDPDDNRLTGDAQYTAPLKPAESALAEIWRKVLKVKRVGAFDNFFELGGDSILSIQIIARAAQIGLRLTPRQVFKHQTVAELAAAADDKLVVAEQQTLTGPVQKTPIQHWFEAQRFAVPAHFNQSQLYAARDRLHAPALERSLQAVTQHHDMLRLQVSIDNGWQQQIADKPATPLLRVVDLRGFSIADSQRHMRALSDALQSGFNLAQGPLLKALLFRLPDNQQERLLLVAHHMVVDWVSWSVLTEDLQSAYRNIMNNEPVQLPLKTTSFGAWADRIEEYANSAEARAELSFWAGQQWAAAGALPDAGHRAADDVSTSYVEWLTAEDTQLLQRQLPRIANTQINDALLTGVSRAICALTDARVACLSLEGHGREDLFDDIDLTRTVGWFTTLYPVALRVEHDDVMATLQAISEQLRTIPNRGFGYGALRYVSNDAQVREQLLAIPQPEFSFNYLGAIDQVSDGDTLLSPCLEPRGNEIAAENGSTHRLEIAIAAVDGRMQIAVTARSIDTLQASKLAKLITAELQNLAGAAAVGDRAPLTANDFPLAAIDDHAVATLAAEYSDIEDIYHVTPLQHGMLFHSLFTEERDVYFASFRWRLKGQLDADLFAKAWQQVVENHSSLRTSFHWSGLAQPVQIVRRDATVTLRQEDWSDLPLSEQETRLKKLLADERAIRFDFRAAPLMRLTLIRIGDDEHHFVWGFHHAIVDGWSVPVVLKHVFAHYEATTRGTQMAQTETPPFREYVAWISAQDRHAAESFWRSYLAGFSAPTSLPGARLQAVNTGANLNSGELKLQVSASTTGALRELAQKSRLTLNTIVQGAWAILLSRYSGETDVMYGATTSGRPAEMEGVAEMIGLFLNTLPLRAEVNAETSVSAWLAELQEQQLDLRQFEYASLVEVQGWSDVPRGTQMFGTLLAFENYPEMETMWTDTDTIRILESEGFDRTNFPLTLNVAAFDFMHLRLVYDEAFYNRDNVQRLAGHFVTLLEAIASRPDAPIAELSLLQPAERRHLLEDFNATRRDYPVGETLQSLFEKQVQRTPDAAALLCDDESLSYAELNARANRVAHKLIDCGIGVDALVGVYMERSVDMVVALYGIVKAGAAYVPLDPEYPPQRLQHMLDDAELEFILTHAATAGSCPEAANVLNLSETSAALSAFPAENPGLRATPGDLAYVIFTSGSTGRPKGVMNEHRGICNRLLWMQDEYKLNSSDRVLQKTPFSFDVSVWEFFWPLFSGASLVVARPGGHRDPEYLAETIRQRDITTLHFVPSMLQVFLQTQKSAECNSLRRVICSGEALSADLQNRFFNRLPGELHNLYGPTEAAVDVTHWACQPDAAATSVPIGRPVANTRVYIVEPTGQPAPVGVAGELWIGGVQVARGYINREELTAERFCPDPFSASAGARVYKTGDLARYRDDGTIEFLGRIDHQVKLRGLRIELGEIEAHIDAMPDIKQSLVMLREDVPGEQLLVAYFTTASGERPDNTLLRTTLAAALPDYMVPSAFILLDEFPLSPNGKVDRKRLPAPEFKSAIEYIAPGNDIEQKLADLWAELLRVDRVGTRDDFFALGGHSLIAMQLASRITETFGVDISLESVFAAPTVAQLAESVNEAQESGTEISEITPLARRTRRKRRKRDE